jgi:ABC-type phosphate/phosphonate transport system substrate-binding protein
MALAASLTLAAASLDSGHSLDASPGRINFVIVYPGGPDTGPEGDRIINQFLDILTQQTSLKRSMISGQYLNDMTQAKAHIRNNRNSFIMGSLGFFLSNREAFGLEPLSLVISEGKSTEQFYVIVKKGAHKSLDSLKGKTLGGNVLYEDATFINALIFENKLNVADYFSLQPTARPLSAVRRVTTGLTDAVLLNGMQYESLKKIPTTFDGIEVVYRSAELPRLGFMMVDTEVNRSARKEILGAIVKMTQLEEGKKVCQNFGITGFQTIQPESLNEVITKSAGGN